MLLYLDLQPYRLVSGRGPSRAPGDGMTATATFLSWHDGSCNVVQQPFLPFVEAVTGPSVVRCRLAKGRILRGTRKKKSPGNWRTYTEVDYECTSSQAKNKEGELIGSGMIALNESTDMPARSTRVKFAIEMSEYFWSIVPRLDGIRAQAVYYADRSRASPPADAILGNDI
jgi:hypothetical protein